jgi:hypothetical protein
VEIPGKMGFLAVQRVSETILMPAVQVSEISEAKSRSGQQAHLAIGLGLHPFPKDNHHETARDVS